MAAAMIILTVVDEPEVKTFLNRADAGMMMM